MGYSNIISRTDADALIPDEMAAEIIKALPTTSAVLALAKKLPNMSRKTKTIPVSSALATAYFVSGDTGLKQTSEANWTNVSLVAEELAVIVPIPQAVLDDSEYDIWGEVRPQIEEAMGRAIDQAVLYGTNIPAAWTTNLGAAGLIAGITAGSHLLSAAAYTDLYEALLGETGAGVAGLLGTLEADGYMATGHIAPMAFRGKLRNVRSTDGLPIFTTSMKAAGSYLVDGEQILFPKNGAISATYWDIAGDWTQLVWAPRMDITYTIADQAVITDAANQIVYNLFQQDMVAMRAVMRLAFALPRPVSRLDSGTGYPFAALTA